MTASTHDASPTISRRRLVKGAAAVAWTVPAIQMVSAVPAFATTGCVDNGIDVNNTRAQWTGSAGLRVDVTVCNYECAPTNVTMTVTFPFKMDHTTYSTPNGEMPWQYVSGDNTTAI